MRDYNAKLRADEDYRARQRARGRARYEPVPPRFTACVVCGERMQVADKRAKVCSPECRHALTLANHRRWKKENPDKTRASAKRYARKNPEKLREKARRYEEANRDKRRAWHRQWMTKNKDHVNAYQKARRQANPERFREYSRKTYAKRGAEIREAARLYRQKNAEQVTAAQRKRYIRERAAIELVKDLGLIDLAKQHGAENETGKTV
jgi:predicted nucleic acid-binding Zn ribbon protein